MTVQLTGLADNRKMTEAAGPTTRHPSTREPSSMTIMTIIGSNDVPNRTDWSGLADKAGDGPAALQCASPGNRSIL